MTFIVAQLGARRHYAIPRILHEAGLLEHFYTDICAVKGWQKMLKHVPRFMLPDVFKRLSDRVPYDIPEEKITEFKYFGLKYSLQLNSKKISENGTEIYKWAGEEFCNRILKSGLKNANGVYTFNSAGLELLRDAKTRGLKTIMEQTTPAHHASRELFNNVLEQYPSWGTDYQNNTLNYLEERQIEEWKLADVILCGSEYVKESIRKCGGPAEKCIVVPYGVDLRFSLRPRKNIHSPVRILTVGAVGIGKGSPFVMEAAKQLQGRPEFRMVGPVNVSDQARKELEKYVQITGPIPRSEIINQYKWADIFLLPSLREGSATVVYEALSAGLPVICTFETGSVIRDGIEGFIVPAGNYEQIIEKIECIISDNSLYAAMSENAHNRSKQFTLEQYGKRLLDAITMNT
jgi:glycosyltransferase involved in cell wall biosynthesis